MDVDGNHSRRSFLKATGGTIAAVSLAGCSGSTDESGGTDGGSSGEASGTINYARGAATKSLDLHKIDDGESVKVTNQIYDKLVQFVPGKNEIEAGLATEWETEGKTITLTLREDVTFHNGEDLTASDFVATYKRFTDPEYEYYIGEEDATSYAGNTFGEVESVEATDETTVTITTKKKFAPMLRNLAVFAAGVMSEKEIETGEQFDSTAVGTGPFTLDAWQNEGEKIRLKANPDYWGETPKSEFVIFLAVGENSTRVSKLTSEDIHIIDGIDAEGADRIDKADGVELVQKTGLVTGYMAMNLEKREEFRNTKVRQALNYAVDTKAIVDSIFRGFASQSSQAVPPAVPGHNEDLDPYPYDQQQATSLLEEAGFGDGFDFTLTTFTNPRPYIPSPSQAAQKVRTDLKEVGINVTIEKKSWNDFLNYTIAGKHDACFLGWNADNGDPDNFLRPLLHPGIESPDGQDWASFSAEGYNVYNASGWANQEFMQKVEEAQTIIDDDDARMKLYNEANQISHDEAPWVFLDHADELRGVKDAVSGFKIAPVGGPFLDLVSVE
ncbi:ABC transporter substrate-binding protein [Halocatena halophila]|uniref:ABC transporter substrate-binding protein n=1 Tax=Halocatena halophila TaxID=2814576 RepID=UPI002ED65107